MQCRYVGLSVANRFEHSLCAVLPTAGNHRLTKFLIDCCFAPLVLMQVLLFGCFAVKRGFFYFGLAGCATNSSIASTYRRAG